jgi:hypothetical protein
MMSGKIYVLFCTVILLLATTLYAADDVSTYLILNDIPPYSRLTKSRDIVTDLPKTIPGYTSHPGAGVLAGVDHFMDHPDMTYETKYQNDTLGIAVEVTKHSGSDSDKWLLHELDDSFRDDFGIPNNSYGPRQINGQTIYVISIGGRGYRWLSGNKVIEVSYHGSLTTLPEPLEVVQAYLAKHPSTLPPITLAQLRSAAKKTTWIKDEMDRRLWLCDKWFMQLQLKKADEKQVYQESVKSMTVFLDYREKYYEVKAADEKNLLAGYLNTNNGTGIKAKLAEYKNWWAVNRDKAIRL